MAPGAPQPPMPPGAMPPPGQPVPGQQPPAYGYPQQGQPTVGPGYQAVLRYRAQDGSEQQLIRRSAPGTPHPEWQIFHELRGMNVPPDQVLELHTELESCELPGAYCARMIREQWPQARITSIAPYGTDHASRQQGMQQLLVHQGELHQVADGPARPAPVRAPLPPVQAAPPIPPEGIAQETAGAFGPGVFRFEQAAVSRQGVPPVVAHSLVTAGLPMDMGPFFWAQAQPGRPVPTLAELAQERGVQPAPDAGSYLVMGSDFGRAICVQYGTANIVAVPVEAGPGGAPVPPQFVNTGLPEFQRCLALLGRMWRLRFGLNQEQAGRWTVDFQAQLASSTRRRSARRRAGGRCCWSRCGTDCCEAPPLTHPIPRDHEGPGRSFDRPGPFVCVPGRDPRPECRVMNTYVRYIKICAKSSSRARSAESSAQGSAERGSRMSSASVSPHGFWVVRGRGYCPDQVDAFADALSLDRDAAWERAARLTVLARDMEEDAALLEETVAQLAPQTYETLGEGARHLFQAVQEEAAAVRQRGRQEAQAVVDAAQQCATGVTDAAQAHADAVLAEADERARQRLNAAHAEADGFRIGTRRAVKAARGEALAALREVRQRTAAMLAEQAKEFAERWAEMKEIEAERLAARDVRGTERLARAKAELAEAKRVFDEAEQFAERSQEEAGARAAEILAGARLREEQIARDTEQVLREHQERSGDVQAQMDNVRNSLTALTGSASGE